MLMKKLSEDHYIVVDDSNKEMHTIPTSEAKELLGVVDVEKKANKQWGNVHRTGVLGYIDGYNQALEDNKEKKYTERDLWRAFDSGKAGKMALQFYETLFQPKTEWEVEFVDGKLKLKS